MERGSRVTRVLHVAQKLVPNYSDFLINVSADDDGASAGCVFPPPLFSFTVYMVRTTPERGCVSYS